MLESIENNPFRRFLTGEPFSIQSSSPIDLQNLNAQSFQNVFTRIFNSLKRDQTEISTSFLDKQPEQKQLNESLCEDDDLPSSSGCSSASSTNGGDDANSEDLIKINIGETDNLTDSKSFDSANASTDLNESTNKDEDEEYVDDFDDNFPNDLLDKLPDGLREVIAQIRETTNADIRQRNKESRITMMMTAEANRTQRKAELRAKMLGLAPPPVVTNGPSHPSSFTLSKPKKFYPWKLKQKFSSTSLADWSNKNGGAPKESQPENNSNILVIDNTNVTLRKKGKSQINEDDDSNVTSSTEEHPSADQQQVLNESDGGATGDDLKEFNTHNYWYISPSSIDIENELVRLKSPHGEKSYIFCKGNLLAPQLRIVPFAS